MGMPDSYFAWAFDTQKIERQTSMSIDTKMRPFKSKNHNITLIDTPGHNPFIKNMMCGTAQTDAVVLVISSLAGDFDKTMSKE